MPTVYNTHHANSLRDSSCRKHARLTMPTACETHHTNNAKTSHRIAWPGITCHAKQKNNTTAHHTKPQNGKACQALPFHNISQNGMAKQSHNKTLHSTPSQCTRHAMAQLAMPQCTKHNHATTQYWLLVIHGMHNTPSNGLLLR